MSGSEHSTVTEPMTDTTGTSAPLPELPPGPASTDTPEARAPLAALRAFARGLPEGTPPLAVPDDDFLPALLLSFRDPSRIRHDYPLLLLDVAEDDVLCRPVGEALREVVATMAPDADDARVLKDNLVRLELHLRGAAEPGRGPADAAETVARAAGAMTDALGLRGEAAKQLADDLRRLRDHLPRGHLLELDDRAPLWLMLAAARHRAGGRRAALRQHATEVLAKLRELMRLDRSKAEAGRDPETLGGGVAGQIDPAALARIVGETRGVPALDAGRRARIEGLITVLQEFLAAADPPLVTVVATGPQPDGWPAGVAEWRPVGADGVCPGAAAAFDEQARTVASVLAALRVGRIELDDRYDATRHEALLAAFDWESFTTEELGLLPVVVAVASADRLAGPGLRDASRLLRSGRPVQVIVPVAPASNPGAEDDPLGGFRFELGYFGISHREAVVQQSSSARPAHLVEGYVRAIDAARAALHVITSGLTGAGTEPSLGAWMHAGAALEGRAHPFFHYDPTAGASWARRFEIGDNPQNEVDWPTYDLACRNADGSETSLPVAFTFADYVLLDGGVEHFRVIPPSADPASLRPLHEHLGLGEEDALAMVPFVWAADAQGHLHRLAVGRRLLMACRDRLDFWRTLQELAGVRNEHVREAVEGEQRRLTGEFDRQREALETEHAAAIERARADAAGDAMRSLARALLDADLETLGGSLAGAAAPPSAAPLAPPAEAVEAGAAAETPAAEGTEAEEEEEEEEVAAEPWIDSPLCTTCNDCIEMNRQLFVYNANKQAEIGDPRAGTYRQLVEAAEKCPARCIHPGLPLDPDEPGLDELIERAKPFS